MPIARTLGAAVFLAAVWLAATACPPPQCDLNNAQLAPDEPVLLETPEGTDTTGVPGQPVTVVLMVTAPSGAYCNASVEWTPGDGSGTVSPAVTTTDMDGITSATWTLGPVGTQTLQATVVNTSPPQAVTFNAEAVPGLITVASGGDQSAPAGTALSNPLEVVLTVNDNRVPQFPLTWTTADGGSLERATTITDGDGVAQNRWTLGPTVGDQTVTVSVPGGISADLTATATPASGSHPKALISAYNGTSSEVTVTMQTPFDGQQVFGPIAPSTQVSDSLQVEPQVVFDIAATLGAVTGSVTCTTTAAIVPNPSDPANTGSALVSVFTNGTGGLTLSCFGGWVGLLRATARPQGSNTHPAEAPR